MDRVTWDAVLARLDDALALCHRFGLGKEVAASRFIEYRRVVTGLVTALRSEEHTSELQSRPHLVCRLLLEKKNTTRSSTHADCTPATRSSQLAGRPNPATL